MSIRAVIFDMGGVIVRTENYGPRDALAGRLGMSRESLETLVFGGDSGDRAQLGEINADEHWENIRRDVGWPPEQMQSFQDSFWGGDVVDRQLLDYIGELRLSFRTALLSNAFSSLRHYLTEVWSFADVFDAIIISAEVKIMKPDARIYHLALEALGVGASEAVFIDDMPHNVLGAQAVGMHAIRFETPGQVYRDLGRMLNGKSR